MYALLMHYVLHSLTSTCLSNWYLLKLLPLLWLQFGFDLSSVQVTSAWHFSSRVHAVSPRRPFKEACQVSMAAS
jgi:hypothetical protein